MCLSVFSASLLLIEEEEEENAVFAAAAGAVSGVLIGNRSKTAWRNDDENHPTKRWAIIWNREHAAMCIEEDYLGAAPTFSMDDFKRIFWVSCAVYDSLKNHLCESTPFFLERYDATKWRKICTDAKVLISLKCLAYGSSVNSFRDYFQFGESTAHLCVEKFIHGIVDNYEFLQLYFCSMSHAELHFDKHGIHGMAGSLDCCHSWVK
jgi:hypothetical protein